MHIFRLLMSKVVIDLKLPRRPVIIFLKNVATKLHFYLWYLEILSHPYMHTLFMSIW